MTWPQEEQFIGARDTADDRFGNSLAVSGDTAIVGAYRDDDRGSSSGSAYVFVRTGGSWAYQTKLTAADGAANDYFGISVAVHGETALVGAHGDDDKGSAAGAVYVFVRTIGGRWKPEAKLTATDGAADDQFGWQLALSGDTALVGSPYDDDKGSGSGSAYVFVRSGTTWSQQWKLIGTDGAAGDHFGYSVGLSGNTALIGANDDDDNGSDSGSAYVFVRAGVSWAQEAKLLATDGTANDDFGHAVALSGDTALIGAPDDVPNGWVTGSAYVFQRTAGSWSQKAKLVAADGVAFDSFGSSVALSGDVAIVGVSDDDHNGVDTGSAYVFARKGMNWTQETKILAPDAAAADHFGTSVQISDNPMTALVGAPFHDDQGTDSGSLYIFSLTRGNGLLCANAAQCQSGFCVDGVCCNTPCNELCVACTTALKGSGTDGFCGPAAEGTDPHNTCADSRVGNPSSCGTDGACSVSGVCRVYTYGTSCGADQCVDGAVQQQICNGFGACAVDPALDDCGSYQCQAGACKTTCTVNQDCAADAFCDTTTLPGKCSLDKPLGATCSSVAQCQSGNCVDGTCCNEPCNGTCQACSAALKGVGADGFCGSVSEGTDPHDTCTDSRVADPDSCGTDGFCSGSGVCRVYASETKCGDDECVAGAVQHQICNGFGACGSDPALDDCAPYQCQAGACKTTCAGDQDCAAEAFCDTTTLPGTCLPDKSDGKECSSLSQCQSGNCVDEVCCNDACTGICQYCNKDANGEAGECHNAEEGTDPHDTCQVDAEECKQDGTCNGAGLCRLQEFGADCGEPVCLGDLLYSQQMCSGFGDCVPNPSTLQNCAPFTCVQELPEGKCATECESDAQCANGYWCSEQKTCLSAVCSDDSTSKGPDGIPTDCEPYKCAKDSGLCLVGCTSVDDCASEHVCDEMGKCVLRASSDETSDGCNCDVAGGGSGRPALPAALLITSLLALRRVQRRTPRRAPSSPSSRA